ncbi:DUF3152 domain-containing protein [Amycolatopsis umgeniensis]|uniref:DUF3152 domain-containing protein n=1 Tax=Amycolatopsis umgeniensis TaxID=336628 RepID=A0A841AR41_9PSEU|nr:DUF3152 domain-containing protein [Amycolatopsis umgeniensis]MBB5851289.1 hypothetical protein [Amycolatopsis umgeniensis]
MATPRTPRKASEADRTWWPPAVIFIALALSSALFLAPFAIDTQVAPGFPEPKFSPQPTVSQPTVPPSEPAALPDGPPFPSAGAGTWRVLPGTSGAVAGTGTRQLTYTVEIEDGIDFPSFAAEVDSILVDPRGWIGLDDVSLRRIDDPAAVPSFRISLTSQTTSRRPDLCGFEIPYDSSCYLTHDHRVVVNLARWVRGAHSFEGDLLGYHRYAVNHEVGHALGHGHVGCPANGAVAPVMMQQTFGLSNGYVADLNRAEPEAAAKVRPDGAACRPNPWVTTS